VDAFLNLLRAFVLSLVLFPVGLATHEVMHLAVYSALGVSAVLQVTHWHFGLPALSRVTIFGLHAAPIGPTPVPFRILLVNNGLGPLLAALPLLLVWLTVDRRSWAVRAALLANVLVLLFFCAIELAYPLTEQVARIDGDVLLLPEVNYGAALLIIALVSGVAAWRSATPRLRLMRGSWPPASRLPAP
jgi:hypothetical protein